MKFPLHPSLWKVKLRSTTSRRKRSFSVLCLSLLVAGASAQTTISIVNPSFESDAIYGASAPTFVISAAPTGWRSLGDAGVRGLLAPNASAIDEFYPGATSGFDGSKIEFHYNGASGIEQLLNESLEPNMRYTLTVASGTRGGASKTPFAGYDIRLETETGKEVGYWIGAGRNLAPALSFSDTSRSFSTGPSPQGNGERLRIRLRQASSGAGGYTDLDNVRLTKTALTTARAASTPVKVFVVAGQSNAVGWQANSAKLSTANRHYANSPDSRALLGYRHSLLEDPVDNVGSIGQLGTQGAGFSTNFNGFGPELSLGTELAKAAEGSVAIIKYSVGSAGLAQNFKKISPTGNRALYTPMIDHVKLMLSQLKDQGYSPELQALFWLQGETDALAGTGSSYKANIDQFMKDVRSDLKSPQLQFYLTQINPKMPSLQNKPGVALVNAAMDAAAKSDSSKVFYLTTDDISSGFADGIHYSADQAIEIGKRWATAYGSNNSSK